MASRSKTRLLHWAWTTFLEPAARVLFAGRGPACLAHTMQLPGMPTALGLTDDPMGFIGAAHCDGYLPAVLLSPALLARLRPRSTIAAALLLIAFGLF